MVCTQVLLCLASVVLCWDDALAKSQDTRHWRLHHPEENPLCFERGWNLLMIIFFSLMFSQGNCEEHECLKDSASLSLEILWTHSQGKSSHDKVKKCNFNYNVHSSLVFGSDFCVFKQKCGFLRLQQCLWMYFFLPELDLPLSGRDRFLFYVLLAVEITLPVDSKLF